MDVLTDLDIAQHFVSHGGGVFTPDYLVKWLERNGLAHRNAGTIAQAINAVQAEHDKPVAAPEGFQAHVREGWGATDDEAMRQMDDIAMANAVAQMNVHEYAQHRERLGVKKNLINFLGGS